MSRPESPRFLKLGGMPFWLSLVVVTGGYLLFIVALLWATASYSTPGDLF